LNHIHHCIYKINLYNLCINCGFIFSFNFDKKRFNKINNRTFLNKKIKIKFPLNKHYRDNKYDRCVLFDIDTEYLIKESINIRSNYIEGIGQTCSYCFNKLNKCIYINTLI
jgi:hypothetical protein